jgi:hypothetical protein
VQLTTSSKGKACGFVCWASRGWANDLSVRGHQIRRVVGGSATRPIHQKTMCQCYLNSSLTSSEEEKRNSCLTKFWPTSFARTISLQLQCMCAVHASLWWMHPHTTGDTFFPEWSRCWCSELFIAATVLSTTKTLVHSTIPHVQWAVTLSLSLTGVVEERKGWREREANECGRAKSDWEHGRLGEMGKYASLSFSSASGDCHHARPRHYKASRKRWWAAPACVSTCKRRVTVAEHTFAELNDSFFRAQKLQNSRVAFLSSGTFKSFREKYILRIIEDRPCITL